MCVCRACLRKPARSGTYQAPSEQQQRTYAMHVLRLVAPYLADQQRHKEAEVNSVSSFFKPSSALPCSIVLLLTAFLNRAASLITWLTMLSLVEPAMLQAQSRQWVWPQWHAFLRGRTPWLSCSHMCCHD